MFECPNKYVPAGIFDEDKLVAFYSAIIKGDHAVCYSAMVHPDYRGKRYVQFAAEQCFNYLRSKKIDYVYLFANKNIKELYRKHMDFIIARQIREYSIDYDSLKVDQLKDYNVNFENIFEFWRYHEHPHHQDNNNKYIYYYNKESKKKLVFSTYEDRVQILDYTDLDDAIGVGMFIVHLLQKKSLRFWSEKDLNVPFVFLPVWKMYRKFNKEIDLYNIIKNEKVRMYHSDVF